MTIHVVLSDRTRGLIGKNELREMKRSAFLINTSRSPIVESDALYEALTEKWIAGAALDVFDAEPVPPSDRLRSVPNLLATPHLGYVTGENYRRYFSEVVDDIRAFLSGNPIRQLS